MFLPVAPDTNNTPVSQWQIDNAKRTLIHSFIVTRGRLLQLSIVWCRCHRSSSANPQHCSRQLALYDAYYKSGMSDQTNKIESDTEIAATLTQNNIYDGTR